MPYTLVKGLVWFALALALGIVIGWLLRSLIARRQVARQRSLEADLATCRTRVAELEPIVDERDRLAAEREALTSQRDRLVAELRGTPDPDTPVQAFVGEIEHSEPIEEDPVSDEPASDEPVVDESPSDQPAPDSSDPADIEPVAELDLAAATAILGGAIKLDDLTVVEGIGPKIAELCRGIGIVTWADLAETEVSLLRTMLADAGPRFRPHDPASWPQQAALLALGRWDEFRQLTEQLDGGR